jgi:hypothetical protein
VHGRHVVSVRDGDFFSDSVWAGGIQPDLATDSIYITTYLHYYQNIILSGSCYMYISHAGTLCGAHDFNLFDDSYLWIRGNLYMDSMLLEATLVVNGYLDGLSIRQEWPGSYLNDSCGETYIHLPPQLCERSAPIAVDTNSFIHQNDKTVTLSFNALCTIRIQFGDGDSAVSNVPQSISHTYAHYGTFVIVLNTSCSGCDTFSLTQQKLVVIDSVIPPYICTTPTSFSVYPDPCDAYFYVKYESCQVENYTIPIYDDIGQKVREVSFDNSGTPVKVTCDDLAAGIYYIKAPDQRNRQSGAKKIVVVH